MDFFYQSEGIVGEIVTYVKEDLMENLVQDNNDFTVNNSDDIKIPLLLTLKFLDQQVIGHKNDDDLTLLKYHAALLKDEILTFVHSMDNSEDDEIIPTAALPDKDYNQTWTEGYDIGKFTLFIVDDDEVITDFFHTSFGDEYNVYSANNGEDALSLIKERPTPDIIISDVVMPGMDGYDFYDNLLKNRRFHSIPFIFLTTDTKDDERLKALEKGAVDCLSKPFSIDVVKAKLSSIIDVQVSKELDVKENLKKYQRDCMEEKMSRYQLTPTEKRICIHILCALENKDIAILLNIKEGSVKFHLTNIFKKCGIKNRVELISLFSECYNLFS